MIYSPQKSMLILESENIISHKLLRFEEISFGRFGLRRSGLYCEWYASGESSDDFPYRADRHRRLLRCRVRA